MAQSRLSLMTWAATSGASPTTAYCLTVPFTLYWSRLLAQTVEIWFGSALLNCHWLVTQVSVIDFSCREWGWGWFYLISGFISMVPERYFGLFNLWCWKVCVLAVLQPCVCCRCLFVLILYVYFIIMCIYHDFLHIIMSRSCIIYP
jgi:hypothetical protein